MVGLISAIRLRHDKEKGFWDADPVWLRYNLPLGTLGMPFPMHQWAAMG